MQRFLQKGTLKDPMNSYSSQKESACSICSKIVSNKLQVKFVVNYLTTVAYCSVTSGKEMLKHTKSSAKGEGRRSETEKDLQM